MESDSLLPLSRDYFTVAIICAKTIENDAVEAMFDKHLDESQYSKAIGDPNSYHLGVIEGYNVVLAYIETGTISASSSAAWFKASFRCIRLSLVVGICGGVPYIEDRKEVLLGDVIISTRLMEYRSGKQHLDKFEEIDTLQKGPEEIRKHLRKLEGAYHYEKLRDKTSTYLSDAVQRPKGEKWKYPGPNRDRLYSKSHRHKHHQQGICETCDRCESDEHEVCENAPRLPCEELGCHETVPRKRLTELGEGSGVISAPTAAESQRLRDPELHIFFGAVASGDLVMKSGLHRDEVVSRKRFADQKIVAFEMEGLGVWGIFPTVIIRGVFYYANSHKNDEWQLHAAARAAACAKAFLSQWIKTDKELAWSLLSRSGETSKWSTPAMATARHLTHFSLICEGDMKQDQTPASHSSYVGIESLD